MSIISELLCTLLETKQKDEENLQEYAHQFETAEEIFCLHMGGPFLIPNLVQKEADFDEFGDVEVNQQCMNDVYERFLAFIFMQQSDHDKYGTLLKTLNAQHSLHNNQYPKTVSEASNVLSNHKHDPECHEKMKKLKKDKK